MIVVTGFGPFPGMPDNPTTHLVEAVNGRMAGSHDVLGVVLPVSWREGPRRAIEVVRQLDPAPVLLLGFGVAPERPEVCVEAQGSLQRRGADVDGLGPVTLPPSPPIVPASLDVARLAQCLRAGISHDAGSYLCNAWAHEVVPAVPCPAAFVHVPRDGMQPERLLDGLTEWLATQHAPVGE